MNFEQADALNRAIRLIGLKHRARAGTLLAELGLHPGQEILLLHLAAHGPSTQRQLATGAGCEPPSVTLMVRKLEAAQLITRRPDPDDGRAILVDLTEHGRTMVARLRGLWLLLAEQTVAGLRDTSYDELVPVLVDLAQSLQQSGTGPAPC